MAFRISGLSSEPFLHLFGLTEAALAERGVAGTSNNKPLV